MRMKTVQPFYSELLYWFTNVFILHAVPYNNNYYLNYRIS